MRQGRLLGIAFLKIKKDLETTMEQIVRDFTPKKDARKIIFWSEIFWWFLATLLTRCFVCLLHSDSRKRNNSRNELASSLAWMSHSRCVVFWQDWKQFFFHNNKILQFIAALQFTPLAPRWNSIRLFWERKGKWIRHLFCRSIRMTHFLIIFTCKIW